MSEEVDFEWPSFSTVLEDVAASRGVDRVLSPRKMLADKTDGTVDRDEDLQPQAIRSELTEPLDLPEPLEPLELDTSRVRELLDSRASSADLDLSALSKLADPAELETDTDLEALGTASEDDADLETESELEIPETETEFFEIETDLETEDLALDTELQDPELENDIFEAEDLVFDTEIEENELQDVELENDIFEAENLVFDTEIEENELQDVELENDVFDVETEDVELDSEIETLEPETDLFELESDLEEFQDANAFEAVEVEEASDVEWPSLEDDADVEAPALEDAEDAAPNTELWEQVSTDEEPVALDWGDEEPVALDWGDEEPESSTTFDSWDEVAPTTGEAVDPAESALVFDMSDDEIIQHEVSAGTTSLEDVFVKNDAPDQLTGEDLDLDALTSDTGDESTLDPAGDDNVVNLFDGAPSWDMEFDSVEVANEIEGDLLDLGNETGKVIPMPNAGTGDKAEGLLGDAEGFEYVAAWSDTVDGPDDDGPKWRALEDEVVEPLEPADDTPSSDPWAFMRPVEETSNQGWWANRPRFLGGKAKKAEGPKVPEVSEESKAIAPAIQVPGLSYDSNCPSCGDEGNLEHDDMLAREVHLSCGSCENSWHAHYEIDAEAS